MATARAATAPPDLILAADPCGRPNARLVVAAARAGALGILDLGGLDPAAAATHLAAVVARTDEPFAVRTATPRDLPDLPEQVGTVIVTSPGAGPGSRLDAAGRRVLVEVTSRAEAEVARAAGASGLVAKGCESGGRVGDTESFVLAQQVADVGLPFWVQGGVGERTAAAAVAGGARGVLLDTQLALVREADLPEDVRAAAAAMDGGETRVVGGHRFYVRPDLPAAQLAADTPSATVAGAMGTDLHRGLVPLGQDTAHAAGLAARYVTTGGVVQAVRTRIAGQLAQAAEHRPLAAGQGIARRHGLRYPVAQGPMTRVSDRPELAAAVAHAGGLPFLALALLPGDEVRALLTRTAELLGERPWGVGILGFVPGDVRAAQLEVIQDLRPPVALIAGGRPSQARPLEAAGIATYLHVPSPGLLDRFLHEGTRRFVFEGRECGGHVGPRASLPLWEAQITRLLDVDDPEELDVLFAGGVHDARSAAMVAAAAAPLAAAGANLGVLMGTAYLFTREAVESGAITATFQDVARGCDATVLLETSPGHATRCVETDYVRAFRSRKAELESSGAASQEVWAELEALNLGRLRVASKGLVRHGDDMVQLDEVGQRRDGMYMIGQVATLRSVVTTVAELHEQVTEGATRHLEPFAAPASAVSPARTQPRTAGGDGAAGPGSTAGGDGAAGPDHRAPAPAAVAIVGMASLFPGARDTDEYWANVVAARDCVTEVPPARWDADAFYDPDAVTVDAGRRTPSRWGGFLPAIGFDPLRYGIPPRSLASVEAVQLLSLEVAARALADAGYDHQLAGRPGPLAGRVPGDVARARRAFDRERASVIFGAEGGNDLAGAYGFRAGFAHYLRTELPPELDGHLPAPTEDTFPGVLTNVIAGRIANRLDLGGVNYTVDAACAASLAALDIACKELAGGTSDLVLCGAADVHNGINDYLMFASVHALSPSGRCRTFDAGADGIALGEGVACVVLKRLADAERDGDRIYAVVEAIAGSSDGRSLGLTAPRQEGQKRALERAYRQAGVSAATVGLVEAHGTGTVVGDRTELATLTEVFGEDDAHLPAGTVLGSVKSQIGHTKCAAGLAGIVKAARALHAGVLPPTCHVESPNDFYEPDASPFRFLHQALPWPAAERRAGVSAFGFGGTNFHAVLRAHDDDRPAHGVASWPAELVLIRADSPAAAARQLAELHETVRRVVADDPDGERHRLRDLAWTVSGAGRGPVHCAVVATSLADLEAKLAVARRNEKVDGVHYAPPAGPVGDPGGIAFLHPGQGSQRPGMLADLLVAFPPLQAVLGAGSPELLAAMFPPAAFDQGTRAAQQAALTDTRVAQPALGLAGVAMTQLLTRLGVVPDHVAGHSYGELVALHTAGVVDTATLVTLSEARGRAMVAATEAQGDDPGAMAAVSLPAAELAARLPADLVVANHNAPRQTVVAGPTAAVERFLAELAAARVGARRIDVAAAFHSPLVAGATDELAGHLGRAELRPPQRTVWSNSTAAPYPEAPDAVRAQVAAQLALPVRFVEQVQAMYASGARVFVEAGPGRVLTQMVEHILDGRPHVAVACDVPGEPGLRRLLSTLAQLAVAGVDVDARPLFEGRAERVDLAALPTEAPGWRVDGHLVQTRDGEPVPGGLQPADRIPEVAMNDGGLDEGLRQDPSAGDQVLAGGPREQTVQDFLRSIERMVEAGRDVLLSYLGDEDVDLPSDLPGHALAALGDMWSRRPAATGAPSTAAADRLAGTNGHGDGTNGLHGSPGSNGSNGSHGTAGSNGHAVGPGAGVGSDGNGHGSRNGHGAADVPSAAEPAAARVTGPALLDAILAVVADRTGYPPEMLDPDLDLEADLSIDSIKRIEIVGEVADRVGLPGVDDVGGVDEDVVEELARLKTLRSIVAWIDEHGGDPAPPTASRPTPAVHPAGRPVAPASAPPAPPPDASSGVSAAARADITAAPTAPAAPDAAIVPFRRDAAAAAAEAATPARPAVVEPKRYVLEAAMLAPALPVASGAGRTFAIVGDAWAGLTELRHRLERTGATVEVLPLHRGAPHTPLSAEHAAVLARVDGVLHLGAADARDPVDARDVFASLKPAIGGRATTLVAAVGPAGDDAVGASGVPGLMRAVARELPDRHVRSVELPADPGPDVLARLLADEALDPAGPVSVAYRDGTRLSRRLAKGVPVTGDTPSLPFDQGSVVVVTGGARGVTARATLAIAQATGCRLELLGRSPLPGDEDPRTAAAPDRMALRRLLAERGELRTPAAIETACDRILAAREVRATLAALHQLGNPTRYHSVDVRDAAQVAATLADIRGRHGRIDAIVHGAGVLDDRLAGDKTDDGFDRVFATKVDAAGHLLSQLGHDVRLVVLFGSISGVLGNRGQVDYCAANDALDELATRLDGRRGCRMVAVDWGPWDGTGMVTDQLAREYARRGVGLLDPEVAVRALLAEMATLPGEPAQVVVMSGDPDAFEGTRPAGSADLPFAGLDGPGGHGDPGDGSGSRPAPGDGTAPTGAPLTLEDLTEGG
jgi:acyl transferase domain-containing protein/NAD(P)H-dependent flavin oxidoreductase YrpB (nitropropane dioxygenase family)/acyl carrier protein